MLLPEKTMIIQLQVLLNDEEVASPKTSVQIWIVHPATMIRPVVSALANQIKIRFIKLLAKWVMSPTLHILQNSMWHISEHITFE